MKKEKIIRKLINNKGYNIKEFSEKIDMPYTTLHSIIKRGINNAAVENVIKIAKGLNMRVEELNNIVNGEEYADNKIHLTEMEKELIELFREIPEDMRAKVKWKFEGIVETIIENRKTNTKRAN